MLKQPVGQVVEVEQLFPDIRVVQLAHAGARVVLDALHRRFRRQAVLDRLADARQPAAILGEHPVGFQDVVMLAAFHAGHAQQVVDRGVHHFQRLPEALDLVLRVLGDHLADGELRPVQHRQPHRKAPVEADAVQPGRQQGRVGDGRDLLRADQFAAGGQFRHHHGDGLEGFDLFLEIDALVLVLDHQHAAHPAAAQDRHAHQRQESVLAGFGPIGEIGMRRGVGERHRPRMGRDIADQALPHPQARLVDRRLVEADGGEQLQDVARPHDVAGADVGAHLGADQRDDLVKAVLGGTRTRHDVAQPCQQAPGRNAGHGRSLFDLVMFHVHGMARTRCIPRRGIVPRSVIHLLRRSGNDLGTDALARHDRLYRQSRSAAPARGPPGRPVHSGSPRSVVHG